MLILDEKSMVGRAQAGRMDCRLRQAYPHKADEILGGLPAIFFGDFAQLPPVGDTPLYSTKSTRRRAALTEEGRRVFESFTQSITLSVVHRQAGDSPEQVAFRDALLRLRTYSTTEDDYNLFATRFWDVWSPDEHAEFNQTLHILPTRAAVMKLNLQHLSTL